MTQTHSLDNPWKLIFTPLYISKYGLGSYMAEHGKSSPRQLECGIPPLDRSRPYQLASETENGFCIFH